MSDSPSGPGLVFCSIATPTHVVQALACLSSLRERHPDAGYVLLLVNAGDEVSLPAGITPLHLHECIAEPQLKAMRGRYSVAELCFAAKPFLLGKLLAAGATQVHYLDGDCLAFAPLTPLIEQLAAADVLLTPHSLSPIPDDGYTPRPLTLLRAGVFNGGYIGVRNSGQGKAFVAWLSAMTAQYASNAPKLGMCGDQRWLDLTPVLFPGMAICRHPGANVAYWNLHERTLGEGADGGILVNGQPLLFFHFSGYEVQRPLIMSRYQSRRQQPASRPTLHRLLGIYHMQASPSSGPDSTFVRRIARLALRLATINRGPAGKKP